MSVEEFHYRTPWRSGSALPGGNAGRMSGSGFEVRGYAPLYAHTDPRRYDVRASLRDPFGQLVVRIYNQQSSVSVSALADVSASMGFVGRVDKWQLLKDFTRSLAYSTCRAGDLFSFRACDTKIRNELTIANTRDKNIAGLLDERLRNWTPDGTGSEGLLAAAERLPTTRTLVFLISDFHFPIALLRKTLQALSMHYVVPVMLWDTAEAEIPRFGILPLVDPESGAKRLLFLRPSLADRIRSTIETRRKRLIECFARYEVTPLLINKRFDADHVTRYFYA